MKELAMTLMREERERARERGVIYIVMPEGWGTSTEALGLLPSLRSILNEGYLSPSLCPSTQAFNSMVQGIGQASERREMSGGGAGRGGRNLDSPNKILLEAPSVSHFILRSKPITRYPGVYWSVIVSNVNVRYTLSWTKV